MKKIFTDYRSTGEIPLLFFGFILIFMIACEGPTGPVGTKGEDGKNSLVVQSSFGPSANCPTGGILINSGIDTNEDGILSGDEVTSTAFICNGVNALVNTIVEAPGDNCVAGGIMVECGPDTNGNGVLDADEVDDISFVCNGTDGLTSLLKLSGIDEGTSCPNGGIKIEAGLDLNANGILDEEEVESVTYVCNGSSDAAGNEVGSLEGVVIDAVTGVPMEAVSVTVYRDEVLVSSITTAADGRYSFIVPANNNYTIWYEREGYFSAYRITVEVYSSIVTFLETTLQIDEEYAGQGTIQGVVKNALNGIGESGVLLTLREGLGATVGEQIASTTTGSGGVYEFANIEVGNYTIEASKEEFVTNYFSVLSIGGITISNQNTTISPALSDGEVRIVLDWGATPSDLDSHLTGPLSNGGRFHTYYGNSAPTSSNSNLDVDDVSSYGPETITITATISGVYRYSVHDYSNKSSTSSFALANSSARVRLFIGDAQPRVFYVPSSGGTLWTVFELNEGVVTPVNAMTYESGPSNITRVNYTTDIDVIKNQIPK